MSNYEKLKERYSQYRIKMKSLPKGIERNFVKVEMSEFLKEVADNFGQSVVISLVSKKK